MGRMLEMPEIGGQDCPVGTAGAEQQDNNPAFIDKITAWGKATTGLLPDQPAVKPGKPLVVAPAKLGSDQSYG